MRSVLTAVCIAAAVQCFTVGVLAPRLPPVIGRPAAEEVRTLAVPGAALVRLSNQDGFVRVRTYAGDQVHVEAEARAYTREAKADTVAQDYVASLVAVEAGPDVVAIVSEPEERPDALDVRIDYSLLVPTGTDINIEGANGNVWVSKGCGRVTVRGRNTDIEIVGPGGPVTARSTNGRIRVLDAQADTDLETVNGNIYGHMRGGALRAVTTNGAIVAHRYQPHSGPFELRSQNGGVTLVMTQDCSGEVDASTGRGRIKCDFPVDCSAGSRKRRRLHGTIGSGHTRLVMDTLNGNIWIARSRP